MVGERRIKGQFVAEGLLFTAVGKPVVNSHFSDEVGAQASELGRRHPPLKTLCPETGTQRTETWLHILII